MTMDVQSVLAGKPVSATHWTHCSHLLRLSLIWTKMALQLLRLQLDPLERSGGKMHDGEAGSSLCMIVPNGGQGLDRCSYCIASAHHSLLSSFCFFRALTALVTQSGKTCMHMHINTAFYMLADGTCFFLHVTHHEPILTKSKTASEACTLMTDLIEQMTIQLSCARYEVLS